MFTFIEVVQGTNVAGASVATSKLTKNAGVHAVFDAGASSRETIAGDGFVEFRAAVIDAFQVCGLSDYDTNADHADILYTWYLRQDGVAEIREGGVVKLTPGAYAVGDTFRVERVGTTIRYYRNGELQYTSAAVSTEELLVDTTLYNLAVAVSVVDGIRLFDATKLAFVPITWAKQTNCLITPGTAHSTRRMRFAVPASMRVGDMLVAAIVAKGGDWIRATNDTWDHASDRSVQLQRGFHVLRHFVDGAEPLEFTVDLSVHHDSIGALVVYRGDGDPATAIGGVGNIDAHDFVATTEGSTPVVTKARATDMHFAVVMLNNPSGQDVRTVIGGVERVEFEKTAFLTAQRLSIVDAIPSFAAGDSAVGVKISGLPGGTSCTLGAILLPARAIQGSRLALPSDNPGAIGLPVEGI